MRALLVSLTNYEHYNYGNTLQCYASNRILSGLGLEVDTLCMEPVKRIHRRNQLMRLFHSLSGGHFSVSPSYWKVFERRNQRFHEFEDRQLSMVYTRELSSLTGRYEYYVVGSDQVWNAEWFGRDRLYGDTFLLTFAGEGRRVCMMPSFGADAVPDRWVPWFQQYLPDFSRISVRESQGARIVRSLTGQEAEVLVDPTLLLTADEWEKAAVMPDWIDTSRPYILTYFLEGMPERAQEQLARVRGEQGTLVYELDSESPDSVFEAGPGEFLYLFSHASLVLTNSFHACVFSYVFHRPFFVYERAGMMSRIDTLLDLLGLEQRLVRGDLPSDVFSCDYTESDRRIETERKKALDFLRNSMKLEEEQKYED